MPALKTYPENKVLKPNRAPHVLLLVADAHEARLYSCKANGSGRPALTRLGELQGDTIEYEDNAGREVKNESVEHRTLEPRADPKQDNRQSFARDIAKRLQAEFGKNGYENIMLIAQPKLLGDLRAVLPANLEKVLIAEAGKELTGVSETELADYLSANKLV